ncbi:Hypothetical protein RAK1035_2619 [Roseovarius sp. AK1035]|nr:Hypothetical protein RAK1035_2619 [Roseovarius sp. AK1035]
MRLVTCKLFLCHISGRLVSWGARVARGLHRAPFIGLRRENQAVPLK